MNTTADCADGGIVQYNCRHMNTITMQEHDTWCMIDSHPGWCTCGYPRVERCLQCGAILPPPEPVGILSGMDFGQKDDDVGAILVYLDGQLIKTIPMTEVNGWRIY